MCTPPACGVRQVAQPIQENNKMSKEVGKKQTPAAVDKAIHIAPPNMVTGEVWIRGTAPLVIHKFSAKAMQMICEKQAAGTAASNKKKREAKDFDAVFNEARHLSLEGWDGIPATAFRNAMISACRLVGFKMTMAKLSIFVEADGYDETDGDPLVRIIGGEPRQLRKMGRLATGVCDVTVRPQWLEWGARLRVRYDADQFTAADVMNLLARAGAQVGICEGRPDSRTSNGMGWGLFEVSDEATVSKLANKGVE